VTVKVTVTFCALLLVSGVTLLGLVHYSREAHRTEDTAREQHAEALRQARQRSSAEVAQAYRAAAKAQAAGKDLEGALRSYREAVELAPDDGRARNGLGEVLQARGDLDGAAAAYRKAIALDPKFAAAHTNLGNALYAKGDVEGAIACFRRATALDPNDAKHHFSLGVALRAKGDVEGAVACWHKAIALDPKQAPAHTNLGIALLAQGRAKEAEAEWREAIRLKPDLPEAHDSLGNALRKQGRLKEAEAAYRSALALKEQRVMEFPALLRYREELAASHNNLGNALRAMGQLDKASAEYRKAIEIDPKLAKAHHNLGLAQAKRGHVEEAIRHYEQALRLDPEDANAHVSLGNALRAKGRVQEAAGHFREALRLDPKYAQAHVGLGNALREESLLDNAVAPAWAPDGRLLASGSADTTILPWDVSRIRVSPPAAAAGPTEPSLPGAPPLRLPAGWADAIAEYRAAIRLKPDYAEAHNNLGNALAGKGQLDEAIAEFREALRLKPDYPEAHCNLGHALRQQGRFEEALACLKRGHELGSKQPGWPYPSARWVRDAERLVALDRKLPAVLNGQAQPAGAAERLGLADICGLTKRYAAAARFYADAFAADPKLADDLKSGRRYDAACYAALAAAGQGTGASKPDDKERARLRGRALGWLRADLALWQKQADSTKAEDRAAARQSLRRWQRDADLAGVRNKQSPAALPAGERAEWEELWAEVADLLRRLDADKKAAPAAK
jgi:tetratricopeptide (TPR) repeat protein